jgi:hypothetical protein
VAELRAIVLSRTVNATKKPILIPPPPTLAWLAAIVLSITLAELRALAPAALAIAIPPPRPNARLFAIVLRNTISFAVPPLPGSTLIPAPWSATPPVIVLSITLSDPLPATTSR